MKQKLQNKRKELVDSRKQILIDINKLQIQFQRIEGAIAILNELLEEKRGE